MSAITDSQLEACSGSNFREMLCNYSDYDRALEKNKDETCHELITLVREHKCNSTKNWKTLTKPIDCRINKHFNSSKHTVCLSMTCKTLNHEIIENVSFHKMKSVVNN